MRIEGKVYLVGAGPGDAELLTLKAARLIGQADIVVYDRLVSPEVLALTDRHCVRHYVGKRTRRHTLDQAEISRLLASLSRRFECVVRLKGGDPFVFGRGGEEVQALAEAGVPYEVVPGITAAQGCAAYAGIPLTHRGLARGVQLVTGHLMTDAPLRLSPAAIADASQTLVVYMGLETIDTVVGDLIAAGRARETPAAIVENGTTARQRRVLSSLERLPADARRHRVRAPAVLIIGAVVSLAEALERYAPVRRRRQEAERARA